MIDRGVDTCSFGKNDLIVMSRCRYHQLLDQYVVTNRAVLPFGQTVFGTGGRNRRVNRFGVAFRGDHLLCCKHPAAFFALCSVGKTRGGAGRLFATNHFGFKMCTFGIAHEAADIAGFIILIVVRMGDDGKLLLCRENRMTYSAMLSLGQACFRTSGRNRRVNRFRMCNQIYTLRFFFSASAKAFLFTVFGASRFLHRCPFTKCMNVGFGLGLGLNFGLNFGYSIRHRSLGGDAVRGGAWSFHLISAVTRRK